MKFQVALRAVRVPFLTGSLVPVLVGAAAAWHLRGAWQPIAFAASLVAMACIQLGSNVLNDYYDHVGGSDGANVHFSQFSGGSRVIQDGLATPREMWWLAVGLLAAGSAVGAWLAAGTPGPWLWVIGIGGVGAAVFYNVLPVQLAARGVGEVVVFLDFGVLPVAGSFLAITGQLAPEAFALGIPVGFLIGNVLYVNEFPDAPADASVGKRTLVVRLGTGSARVVAVAAVAGAFVSTGALVVGGMAPTAALWTLAAAPLGLHVCRGIWSRHDRPADLPPVMGGMIALHLLFGSIFAGALALAPPLAPGTLAPWPATAPWSTVASVSLGRPAGDGAVPPAGDGAVRVAVMGPLTGPAAAYGVSQLQGALLAADEVDAIGGLGTRLEIVAADDHADPALVGELARDLALREGVRAFVGCVNSACTHVLEMLCAKLQVPQITCVSTDPSVTRAGSPWIFRCLADDERQARALARHVLGTLQARRVALLALDDRYGRQGAATFVRELAAAGRSPVASEVFPRGDQDRAPLAARVAAASPDAVVLWSLYREGAAVVRALRQGGVTCPVAGPDGLTTAAFLEQAGRAAEGAVVTFPFNPERDAPETRAFLAAYRARYGAEPDSFAAHAYDAVHVLASALRVGGAEAAALRDALARTSGFRGATGVLGFDRSGNDTRDVELAVVRLGRFVPLPASASR